MEAGERPAIDGTSPRSRGNHHRGGRRSIRARYIPALAGEPAPVRPTCRPHSVHPRARGGTHDLIFPRADVWGTSPRSRGNPGRPRSRGARRRYIPALAGEPHRLDATPSCPRVHPRARGGTADTSGSVSAAVGTSPRSRGNPSRSRPGGTTCGYIPALAGEPRRSATCVGSFKVHPRARGGTERILGLSLVVRGTSPRSRGNRPGRRLRPAGQGYIPALAGEPSRRPGASAAESVHPRARGGTHPSGQRVDPMSGTSPRSRGNRRQRTEPSSHHRYIPALAGEPPKKRRIANRGHSSFLMRYSPSYLNTSFGGSPSIDTP